MINLITIDDEPLALKLLEVYIGRIPELKLLASCNSARSAEPWIEQADALLIDINMPDLNGMEFVRSLDEPPLVIFTTAYSEYAVEGFRVNAVDYLLKPFSFNEFQNSIKKLEERLAIRRAKASAPGDGILRLSTPHRSVQIDTDRIRYIEGMGEYLKIHLDAEAAPMIVLYRMKNILAELPAGRFIRIHKSYIVPAGRIREVKRSAVTLDDGTSLPVGEAYRDELRTRFS
ncbi:MAG: response regulator transcription factor [Bacteroidales bacterium]|nr:response regulator transcription factor [Bacteroidales bacterium]